MVYKNTLPVIPIQIEFKGWSPNGFLLDPKPTAYQRKISQNKGTVQEETITEYKDFGENDEDFSGIGEKLANFAKLDLDDGWTKRGSGSDNEAKSATSSDEEAEAETAEDEAREFERDILKVHNEKREMHGVKPLKMSREICKYAQEWAEHLAAKDDFEHRQGGKYGENLYMSWSSSAKAKISGSAAAESWYSEVSKHQFGVEPRSMGTGHFTQMIWKGSKKFGVGKARSNNGKTIVVANYEPAGNYIGRYVENVPPPTN